MFSTKKFMALIAAIMFVFSSSMNLYAFDKNDVEKIREEVQNASPNDWQTLANCADKCLRKNVNVNEALEWIEKSIEINPNPENLVIKGDYYYRNKKADEAIVVYLKALEANNHTDKLVTEAIQFKIQKALELKKQGY